MVRQLLGESLVEGGGLMDPEATTIAVSAALGDLSQAIGAALTALYRARA